MTYAAEVKRLREAAGLSQAELAEKLGVSQGAISHIETGRDAGVGNVPLMFKLAAALSVDCSHFAKFFEEPAPTHVKKKGKKK